MTNQSQRNEVVAYWQDKAIASLSSAERELHSGSLDFAINRIYYANFYTVSALLLQRGLSFKKHSGVRAAFHREFVATGRIAVQWGKFYDRLFEDRQEGDYVALAKFEPAYVEENLKQCRLFLEMVQELAL